MNIWTAENIKSLRLRLGWSVAEFSRNFGGSSELVMSWERGEQRPSPSDILQLSRLDFYMTSYSDQVERDVRADIVLKTVGLEQVHQSQISKYYNS